MQTKTSFIIGLLCYSIFSFSNQEKLRILFVVGYFPVLSETFILNQITGLIDRCHDVRILSFNRGTNTHVHDDVKKYKLMRRTYFETLPINQAQFDVIYCQFGYSATKFLTMKKQRFGYPRGKIVVCMRGSDITRHLKKNPNAYDKLFKKARLLLPVCEYFKKKLLKLGCKKRKVTVHHSAIDCNKFRYKKRVKPKNGTINIISVCRLVEKKGLPFAIRAVARLVEKYPEIQYTIVGDGVERECLQQLITELGMQEHIHLLGYQIHKQVVKALDRSHIFVLPSVTAEDGNEEGIPNSMKEAMAMGLPVVGTKHAGIVELVEDGKSGYLVEQKNVDALTEKIEYLINHPEEWQQMGKRGREKVEKEYDIKKLLDRIERIFKNMIRIERRRLSRK